MADDFQFSRRKLSLGLGAAAAASLIPNAWATSRDTYSEPEIIQAAEDFFGASAEGIAGLVRHVFEDYGAPNGFVQGQEGSGALGFGLRYGRGDLFLRTFSNSTHVFWQGPSIGFDTGGNASKVFTLAYNMTQPEQIFRRFPGVDGSAYFIGGVGVNYQRAENIVLAPMRAGIGFRLGASIGYLAYSRRRRLNPF